MDFDGDGRNDILSGSYPGELSLFRRQADGSFAAAEVIDNADGEPLKVGLAAAPFACDWDGDGDLDLLVGDIQGQVYLVANEGTRGEPAFGKPQALSAGGSPIRVGHGDAGPSVADWDGDGLADLLVGAGDGSVSFYRNEGTAQAPQLAAAMELVAPSTTSVVESSAGGRQARPGMRAKVCATDVNGDGRLDLLVGDFSLEQAQVDEKIADEQKQKAEQLQARLDELKESFAAARKAPANETDEARLERVAKMKEITHEMREVRQELAQAQPVRSPYQYHGWVWLYLREPPTLSAAGG